MNYLLVNTANDELVIVLSKNGTVFACNERNVKKHNEILLPKFDQLLNQANITLNDIDEFGVVVGPGSFTGIRVGIATIKAFKDVTGKPVRAINNLNLLHQIAKSQFDIVAIEGSLNSYFVGKFENDRLNIYERNLTADELKLVAGDKCVGMYSNAHNFELGKIVEFDNNAFIEAFNNSQTYDLTPIYYQLSQAENDKISRTDIVVREAEVYDIKDILNIGKISLRQDLTDSIESKLLNKNYITYVSQIENQIIGFVIADINDIKTSVKLNLIAVDTNFRNHGVGAKLIDMVENLAKEHKSKVVVSILTECFSLETLCKKLGYVKDIDNDKILIKNF